MHINKQKRVQFKHDIRMFDSHFTGNQTNRMASYLKCFYLICSINLLEPLVISFETVQCVVFKSTLLPSITRSDFWYNDGSHGLELTLPTVKA